MQRRCSIAFSGSSALLVATRHDTISQANCSRPHAPPRVEPVGVAHGGEAHRGRPADAPTSGGPGGHGWPLLYYRRPPPHVFDATCGTSCANPAAPPATHPHRPGAGLRCRANPVMIRRPRPPRRGRRPLSPVAPQSPLDTTCASHRAHTRPMRDHVARWRFATRRPRTGRRSGASCATSRRPARRSRGTGTSPRRTRAPIGCAARRHGPSSPSTTGRSWARPRWGAGSADPRRTPPARASWSTRRTPGAGRGAPSAST
jgi:hypothetical protein